jgi:4-carboxymuconolactone decarboxylase
VTSRDQVAEKHRMMFDLLESRPGLGRVRAILLRSPELGKRISDVDEWLSTDSQVTADLRELAILATAREKDAAYLWSTHVPLAREAGVGETIVDAVRDRTSPEAFPPGLREVVDYVRQQLRAHRIAEELFERLRENYGARWLVELTCLIGHYGLISGIVNAFELAPDEGADPLPVA